MAQVPIELLQASALGQQVRTNYGLEVKASASKAQIIAMLQQAGFSTTVIDIQLPDEDPIQRIMPPMQGRFKEGFRFVELMIPSSEKPGGKEPWFGMCNGVAIFVPRDQWVWVDYKYYHILQNATEKVAIQDEDNKIVGWNYVPATSFSTRMIEPELSEAELRKAGKWVDQPVAA